MSSIISESRESALQANKKKRDHLAGLLDIAKERNLDLLAHVEYDGDCLFNFVKQLVGSTKASTEIRGDLVNFFEEEQCSHDLQISVDQQFLCDLREDYNEWQRRIELVFN